MGAKRLALPSWAAQLVRNHSFSGKCHYFSGRCLCLRGQAWVCLRACVCVWPRMSVCVSGVYVFRSSLRNQPHKLPEPTHPPPNPMAAANPEIPPQEPASKRPRNKPAHPELIEKCVKDHDMGYKEIAKQYPDWNLYAQGLRDAVARAKAIGSLDRLKRWPARSNTWRLIRRHRSAIWRRWRASTNLPLLAIGAGPGLQAAAAGQHAARGGGGQDKAAGDLYDVGRRDRGRVPRPPADLLRRRENLPPGDAPGR